MRVKKGDEVTTTDKKFGVVLEDADDRQGHFWMRFGILVFTFDPKREDVCVPFAAIEAVKSIAFGHHNRVRLTLDRHEAEQLPQRWQLQPQPTVQEMVRSLPIAGAAVRQTMATGAFPMIPQPPQPMAHPIVAVQQTTLASILEAKRRHAERCQGATPEEQALYDKLLTDELMAIQQAYERETAHLRMAEGI